jgi:hypothetical protein
MRPRTLITPIGLLTLTGCYEPYWVQDAPAEPPPSEAVMYTTLTPYGSWIETDIYGSLWCPSATLLGADYAPYHNGRWVWTDAGWYFEAYEPWGWLPYHYGSWVSLDVCPWGWVPGFTWGPAWVAWYGGHPYPISPRVGRPIHIARPPGVHVGHPVSVRPIPARLDLGSGQLYVGNRPTPVGARLVVPPAVTSPAGPPSGATGAHGGAGRGFGGAGRPLGGATAPAARPGATGAPRSGGSGGTVSPHFGGGYSAPAHAGSGHVGASHGGGGHGHR